MRQSIGGIWLLQLVVLFILLFVGFIILTLNYSRSVRIKNEAISIVEKYEGLNETSIRNVNTFLYSSGYGATGVCTNEEKNGLYGALDLSRSTLEEARANVKYFYCVKKLKGTNTTNYYQLTLFYKFNLPVIGDRAGFSVKGTTTNFQSLDSEEYNETS